MLELYCYGLTGLAAMLVVAFCLTYIDEFQPDGARSPRPRGTAREQQETLPVFPLQTTVLAETGSGFIYSDSLRGDRRQVEVLHG